MSSQQLSIGGHYDHIPRQQISEIMFFTFPLIQNRPVGWRLGEGGVARGGGGGGERGKWGGRVGGFG